MTRAAWAAWRLALTFTTPGPAEYVAGKTVAIEHEYVLRAPPSASPHALLAWFDALVLHIDATAAAHAHRLDARAGGGFGGGLGGGGGSEVEVEEEEAVAEEEDEEEESFWRLPDGHCAVPPLEL
jgi:hypothetical protein